MPAPVAIGAQITADATGYIRPVNQATKSTRGLHRAMGRLEQKANRTTTAMSALGKATAAIAAFGGFIRGATSAVRLTTQWERQLINVGKNAGITGRELAAMGDRLTGLSVELGATRGELAEIARVAGQLGVEGVDNISNFTKVMFEFADATDVTAEEGAKVLQRFLSISNLPTSSIDHLTDVITKLGSSAAVGETELTGMFLSLRVGSVGVNLSIDFFGKLATVLAEGGVQAEAARTGFLKFNQALKNTANQGGQDLQFLAGVAGTTMDEFRRLLDENPEGLLNKLYFGAAGLDQEAYNRYKSVLDQEGARASVQQDIIRNAVQTGRFQEIEGIVGGAAGERGRQAGAQRDSLGGLLRSTNAQFLQQFARLADAVTPSLLVAYKGLAEVFKFTLDVLGRVKDGFFAFAPLLERTVKALGNFFFRLATDNRTALQVERDEVHANLTRARGDLGIVQSTNAGKLAEMRQKEKDILNSPDLTESMRTNALRNIRAAIRDLEAEDTEGSLRVIELQGRLNSLDAQIAVQDKAIADALAAASDDGSDDGGGNDEDDDEPAPVRIPAGINAAAWSDAQFAGLNQYRGLTGSDISTFRSDFGERLPEGLLADNAAAAIAAEEDRIARMEELNSAYRARDTESLKAYWEEQARIAEEAKEKLANFNKQIGDSFEDFVAEPMRTLFDGGSFSDAIDDALKRLRNEILELIFLRPLLEQFRKTLDGIMNSQGGGGLGGLGGLLSGGFGTLGGVLGTIVGGPLGIVGSLFGLADGGHVTKSGYAVVGEEGAEIRRLNAGDAIYPHGSVPAEMMGGRAPVNVSINVNGVQDEDIVKRAVRELYPEISQVVQGDMVQESRIPSPVSEAFNTI